MMNFKFILKAISVALVSFSLTLISAVSFAATDVRIMWYGDGDKEMCQLQHKLMSLMQLIQI